ncbi:MAG: hypothetical protein GEU28_04110 [Dehalococcoidia bacterium]|nr:hypothetical protein [Dehalococcoidia bacterium]
MGGRNATLLLAAAAAVAVLVMVWSLADALSLTGATPYWVASMTVTLAIIGGLLVLRDFVLWPFKVLLPKVSGFLDRLLAIFKRPERRPPARDREQARPPVAVAPPAPTPRPRRQH